MRDDNVTLYLPVFFGHAERHIKHYMRGNRVSMR